MNKLSITSLVILIFAQACSPYKKYFNTTHDYKTDIPIAQFSDNQDAILYFDDVPFPNKPYIQGGVIEVSGKSSTNSTTVLASALRSVATGLGYDGVVEIQKQKREEETVTLLDVMSAFSGEDSGPSYANFSYLSGIGIKFIENINYLDQFIKTQNFWVIDGTEESPFMYKTYYPDGEFKKIRFDNDSAQAYYEDKIKRYDLKTLMEDEKGWEVRLDSYGRIKFRRQKRFDDWVIQTIRYRYNKEGVLNKLEFVPPAGASTYWSQHITLHRDDNGKIISKKVFKYGSLLFTEDFYYSENQLISSEIYEPNWNEQKIRIDYNYYDKSDFPELSEY